jgi:hypothetical protein
VNSSPYFGPVILHFEHSQASSQVNLTRVKELAVSASQFGDLLLFSFEFGVGISFFNGLCEVKFLELDESLGAILDENQIDKGHGQAANTTSVEEALGLQAPEERHKFISCVKVMNAS